MHETPIEIHPINVKLTKLNPPVHLAEKKLMLSSIWQVTNPNRFTRLNITKTSFEGSSHGPKRRNNENQYKSSLYSFKKYCNLAVSSKRKVAEVHTQDFSICLLIVFNLPMPFGSTIIKMLTYKDKSECK